MAKQRKSPSEALASESYSAPVQSSVYSLEAHQKSLAVDPSAEAMIEVWGAREHNLKNINVTIPRDQLVVITGVSGSGKSSLAFDTLYAEGQRRYLDTFSTYIRQFIGSGERPDVDKVNGLCPVIAIDQKTTSRNPRSTVGTITELYDFLRLLYARASEAFSYVSGKKMEKLTETEIIQRIETAFNGQAITILAPIIKGRKGHHREEIDKIRQHGYGKARIDGHILELKAGMLLDRHKIHDIEAVIDRLEVIPANSTRLSKSVQSAMQLGKGTTLVLTQNDNTIHWFYKALMDPENNLSYDEPAPNSFSFNSHYGWCPACHGMGQVLMPSIENIITDPNKPIFDGGITLLNAEYAEDLLDLTVRYFISNKLSKSTTYNQLPETHQKNLLFGKANKSLAIYNLSEEDLYRYGYLGIVRYLSEKVQKGGEGVRAWAEQYLTEQPCPSCNGARLKQESLWFKIADKNIYDLSTMSLEELAVWLDQVDSLLTQRQRRIATELLKEIRKRLGFLLDIGLNYLTLARSANSLSGGEAQRIRLATQIGSQLVGVLYILDEPSIGLHQRDNSKLIGSLKHLRDIGNSVIVVEHDKEMMLEADYIIDIGPAAGVSGGQVVACGRPVDFMNSDAVTADFLAGRRTIPVPTSRRQPSDRRLKLIGATGHNLKNVTLELPLGLFICVTGVSGSGKSSLINRTLYPILHQHAFHFKKQALPYQAIEGLTLIDKVIEIDQKPIGRTPRSNPATYTGLFTHIRDLYAKLPESKARGYKVGRFSFNVKGGRCETCGGAGVEVIEMNFLPDVHVNCPTCRGRRYNRETLEVRYKGKSINDVLNMPVNEALGFFEAIPAIKNKLQTLADVGLGYITIGQPATTLSGGEAQRMKVATELSKRPTGKTIYILDEPTTGLHFQDIEKLLHVLQLLVGKGNTVLVIEHNLDVIKVADWVIDLGPEGGKDGGYILGAGTPEDIARLENSHTGRYLKKELGLA